MNDGRGVGIDPCFSIVSLLPLPLVHNHVISTVDDVTTLRSIANQVLPTSGAATVAGSAASFKPEVGEDGVSGRRKRISFWFRSRMIFV